MTTVKNARSMFSPISDYGLIGNLRTGALVCRNGNIDWFCGPNYDSGPVFFPLLDPEKGGFCRLSAKKLEFVSRSYVESTAMLRSEFKADGGRFSITDFMPVLPGGFAGKNVGVAQICRILRCDSGSVQVDLAFQPSFAFEKNARGLKLELERNCARYLYEDRELAIEAEGAEIHKHGDTVRLACKLGKGRPLRILLTLSQPVGLTRHGLHETQHLEEKTQRFWQRWAQKIQYAGPYRDEVVRSAITLKLCQFSATGAIVAAPTTSLPERIGDQFNWDYRFTWLRDAAFTAVALLSVELSEEAFDFLKFVHSAVQASEDFHTLYTIFGKVPGKERELRHLAGYCDSRPVRVGNAAAGQLQLDIFGELLHCIDLLVSHSKLRSSRVAFDRDLWPLVQDALEAVCDNWRKPDKGIWETRDAARRFVYSQGMCLVALQRGMQLARRHGKKVPARWEKTYAEARREFEKNAYNPEIRSYAQSYGSDRLDASVLRLPTLGVISCRDKKLHATLRAIGQNLMQGGFILRNRNLDGAKSGEGAFLPCSFWYADNLVLTGRIDEGRKMFERLLGCANDLGLYSEEFDGKKRRMLGNFPQAFTHVALINSAVQLAIAARGHKSESHKIVEGGQSGSRARDKKAAA